MFSVIVKLLASAALPASVLPSVVSETRPCRAFRLVTLRIASPCAAGVAAATDAAAKMTKINRLEAAVCLELKNMRPLPSDHHQKLPGFLIEIGLGLLHHGDRGFLAPAGLIEGPAH